MEKMLLLGVDTATKFIIENAKKQGIYIILTDYLPVEKSPLKGVVDEAWTIDVGEVDILEQKCRENGVNIVMAGNHEFCLDSAKELARRLGLPFYAGDYTWTIARDKELFKKLCIECGQAVPEDYTIDGPIEYPVVVKPADASAQRGLSVVYREEDIKAAYEKALSFSDSKKIIIERFLTGDEIMIVGYADQGNYHYLFAGEIQNAICGGKGCISIAPHSPSRVEWLNRVCTDKLWAVLSKMELKNGLFILQGFAEGDKFYLMEPGIRFDGGVTSRLAGSVFDFDPVDWMIDLARGKKPEIDWSKIDVSVRGKAYAPHCIYNAPGTIASKEGLEEVSAMEGVRILLDRFQVGQTVEDVGNMTQVAYYIHLWADTAEGLVEKLKKINSTLKIYDTEGNSMLLYYTDYEKIYHSLTY